MLTSDILCTRMSHTQKFLHLFVFVCLSLLPADQATYILEEVKPPPAKFIMNDEILDAFAGPEGIWQIMREEHASREGEAVDDWPGGELLEVVSFVDKVLKCRATGDKIVVRNCSFGWL